MFQYETVKTQKEIIKENEKRDMSNEVKETRQLSNDKAWQANKNIIAVSMVKNEEIIIESFIRYTLTFCDAIIIFNHNSDDGTKEILMELMHEYGNRIIIHEEKTGMTKQHKLFSNILIKKAIEEYDADIVVPLDADEFPISTTERSVREILEQIEDNSRSYGHFMQFAPIEEIDYECFVPLQFNRRRRPDFETEKKSIMTKFVFENFGAETVHGNHEIYATKNCENISPTVCLSPELYYAHFTAQTIEAYEKKVVISWLANVMRPDKNPGESIHLEKGFRKMLKQQGSLKKDIEKITLLQSFHRDTNETVEEIVEEIEPASLWPQIEVLYTKKMAKRKDKFVEICEFAEQIALENRENAIKLSMSEEQSRQTEQELLQKSRENEALKKQLSKVKQSKSWRLTKPLRSISKAFGQCV